jgi:hypothetical protein
MFKIVRTSYLFALTLVLGAWQPSLAQNQPSALLNPADTKEVNNEPLGTLLSFTGKVDDDDRAQLIWTTVNEANSRAFVVERSADGLEFAPIDRIKASGTNQLSTYITVDRHPLTMQAYYRLRLVDLDSSIHYSATVALEPKTASTTGPLLSVWPSLAKQNNTVLLSLKGLRDFSQPVKVRVYELNTGHLVAANELPAAADISDTLVTSELAAGNYYVKASAAEGHWFARMVVH